MYNECTKGVNITSLTFSMLSGVGTIDVQSFIYDLRSSVIIDAATVDSAIKSVKRPIFDGLRGLDESNELNALSDLPC